MAADTARDAFAPAPGYLNAATLGLPPRTVTAAMHAAVDEWAAGKACAVAYDAYVQRARTLYADLVGVGADRVAIGSQTSVFVGLVAAALPDGARVVCVDGDFSSVTYPFLVHADRGVTVRHVPLAHLAEATAEGADVVAFSLAQSATGELADADAVRRAAAEVGALTVCDTTQAAGWLPLEAGDFDVTVCSAYKWLCHPRGAAYLTTTPAVDERLRPINAGWYAGESVWDSCYGPGMQLAKDARQFDVSPAWLAWVGAVPALELFCRLDIAAVRDHDVALADALLARLDLAPQGRPVVSLPDPDGAARARLEAAGCSVAGRAGRVRIAFHLWNDETDVDLAARALRR